MSAELLPCYRCGKAPTVETYDGYPRVSCDCYSGPDAFCATWLTVDGAIQDWNDHMEQEEPFSPGGCKGDRCDTTGDPRGCTAHFCYSGRRECLR